MRLRMRQRGGQDGNAPNEGNASDHDGQVPVMSVRIAPASHHASIWWWERTNKSGSPPHASFPPSRMPNASWHGPWQAFPFVDNGCLVVGIFEPGKRSKGRDAIHAPMLPLPAS